MSIARNQEDQSVSSPKSPRTESNDQVQEHHVLQSGDDQKAELTHSRRAFKNMTANAVDLDSETDLLPVGSSSSASFNQDDDVMTPLQNTDSNDHGVASTDTDTNGLTN